MISLEENKRSIYPKINTLFNRDTSFKVKIDEFRDPEFALIKKWEVTEKIDGTNVRIVWKDKELSFFGRTEKAELPTELEKWLEENINKEHLLSVFGEKEVVLYGEGYGNKIQSGKLYSPTAKFILFDIKIDKFWLNRASIEAISNSLQIECVPYLGEMTIEEITEFVEKGFQSKIGNVPVCEGIIAKTNPCLFSKVGERLIFKLKHTDFKK